MMKDSEKKSNLCVSPKFTSCIDHEEEECVGKAFADYIYSLSSKSEMDIQSVDGGYSEWSEYSDCSATCGNGIETRERTCTNPVPQGAGKDCTDLGDSTETQACKIVECPVNGGFTPWTEYGECDKTCGGGTQTRTRSCTDPAPAHGGEECHGPTFETKECNPSPCPVDGGYGSWSDYGACSASCGPGTQESTRQCNNPAPAHGGNDCEELGPAARSQNCEVRKCTVNGGYGPWGDFGECSVTCGGGLQTRSRQCNNPTPAHGGDDCTKLGPSQENQGCNMQACPQQYGSDIESRVCEHQRMQLTCVVGVIEVISANFGRLAKNVCGSSNSLPTNCRATTSKAQLADLCDGKKSCTVIASSNFFGNPCHGIKYLESKHRCILGSFAVNGGYGPWSDYGECSKSCGVGIQQSRRECNHPEPANGGINCKGPASQIRNCEVKKCPVNGGYGAWGAYSACSVTCGEGFQSRNRQCNNPTPAHGGDDCTKDGPGEEKRPCHVQACPPRYGPEISNRVCEWNRMELRCASGVIDIVSANYGRTSILSCGYLFWWQLSCRASNSSSKMAELCNGKKSCVVDAANSVFGDPCKGTYKYLEVKHRCRLPQ